MLPQGQAASGAAGLQYIPGHFNELLVTWNASLAMQHPSFCHYRRRGRLERPGLALTNVDQRGLQVQRLSNVQTGHFV